MRFVQPQRSHEEEQTYTVATVSSFLACLAVVMPLRLEDRLRAARDRLFVGRDDELTLFREALAADEPPFFGLYVFGPGGVGKTSLLRAYQRLCNAHDVAATYLDARDVEPVPQAFLAALHQALGLPGEASPEDALDAGRHALLIDTCEAIAPLDGWLRTTFLPQLPQEVLVVLAGRDLPSRAWRTDPGWQALVRLLPLRNLDPEASRTFLYRRDVPEAQYEAVLNFTHGHPLATSLVADLLDQQPGTVFQPEDAPGVIQALLEQFVQHVPGPAHRAALETCSLVRFTTETLLRTVLEMPEVHELFTWLRGLSFVEVGTRGLFPHDLAREVLAADLRWRNPEWYADLHRRARHYYSERLKQAGGRTDRLVLSDLSDYTFLHRDHPLVRPLFARLRAQWGESNPIQPEHARAADDAALVAMVEQHEGPEAARIARHWLDRQHEGVTVYRGPDGTPHGFQMALALDEATPEDRAADPAAEKTWAYVQERVPLRPGEHATLFRFWMARDTYQDVSPVQSLIVLSRVRHYLNTPGLAYTLLTCRAPDVWGPIFLFGGMTRLAEADFEVGGHTYGVFGHDWRAVPPTAWLDRLAERRFGAASTTRPAAPDLMVVLNQSSFEEAVRDALKAYARPGKLRGNPLLRSRLVAEEVGLDADEADRIEALRAVLAKTIARLDAGPRDTKYYRAVYRTYLQPAPTQEQAAEQLDLPFSTFRRHLKRGLERVTDLLWEREVGAP